MLVPLAPGLARAQAAGLGALESDPFDGPRPTPGGKPAMSKAIGDSGTDAGSRRIENTAAGLRAPGSLIGPESSSFSPETADKTAAATPAGAVPELHVVQKGDTLWSLCSRYFGDPWRWPRLWAQNPIITNPHWIFPGDVIRLGEPAALPPPPAAAVPTAPRGMISVNRIGMDQGNAVLLREMGFIEARDLEEAAVITGSREEKIILSTGDLVYLRYPKRTPLRAGDRYSVFTTDMEHPVVDIATGKKYGYLVRILGDVVINQIAENDVARGALVDTVDPIERGARASAFVHQFKRIEPQPSKVDLEARVIATFAPNTLLGAGNFVVINRGKRDGVEVGNRTFVVRRGDGYRGIMGSWEVHDPDSPREVVGEVWVVDVRDNASVAWIARSNKELRVGEITEMRKGY